MFQLSHAAQYAAKPLAPYGPTNAPYRVMNAPYRVWQHNPAIRAFCERLDARGKNGMAIACAAMRKMVHIAFAILKSGKPFDPEFMVAKEAA